MNASVRTDIQSSSIIIDKSGLAHYTTNHNTVNISDALKDALKYLRPPMWFWYQGTPAPIFKGDTSETLAKRWNEWRSSYEENPSNLCHILGCLPRM